MPTPSTIPGNIALEKIANYLSSISPQIATTDQIAATIGYSRGHTGRVLVWMSEAQKTVTRMESSPLTWGIME